ncbi:MAG: hypothetical protein ACI4RG_07485, partial [Huintestinicola sp.]
TPSIAGRACLQDQSPLLKQSTGLFWGSPLAELLRKGDFALCGGRQGAMCLVHKTSPLDPCHL